MAGVPYSVYTGSALDFTTAHYRSGKALLMIVRSDHPSSSANGVLVAGPRPAGRERAYSTMPDEELVDLAQGGDEVATERLLRKYNDLVRKKTGMYFLAGADREDLIQEGMIGLYRAILDFRRERLSPFPAFAALCIKRQVIAAMKAAARQKHIPLNSYISFDKPVHEDSEETLIDVIGDVKTTDPEAWVTNQEVSCEVRERIWDRLSDLERQVLAARLEGKSYQETADGLQRRVKAVDHALQRVRRKLERSLASAGA